MIKKELQQKLLEKNSFCLCGLTTDQFEIILQFSLPYIHLILYPDCVGGVSHRKLDSATEPMAV